MPVLTIMGIIYSSYLSDGAKQTANMLNLPPKRHLYTLMKWARNILCNGIVHQNDP